MATDNVTPIKPTDVWQLVSGPLAERQIVALAHAREALRLSEELLNRCQVTGQHRLQLDEALEYLKNAVDYLGPVEEFLPLSGQVTS
jgi:hypothetical protein